MAGLRRISHARRSAVCLFLQLYRLTHLLLTYSLRALLTYSLTHLLTYSLTHALALGSVSDYDAGKTADLKQAFATVAGDHHTQYLHLQPPPLRIFQCEGALLT